MAVGEEAVVANAMEAVRQRVQQEAPDELLGVERHDLRPAAMAIIPPAEGDAIVLHADQPGIGDGDAVGVAAEIGQYLLLTAEGRLGVDDPFPAAGFGEQTGEGIRLCQAGEIAEEAQQSPVMGRSQPSRKRRRNRRDSTRTGRKNPRRQEIQREPWGETPPPGTMQWMWGW